MQLQVIDGTSTSKYTIRNSHKIKRQCEYRLKPKNSVRVLTLWALGCLTAKMCQILNYKQKVVENIDKKANYTKTIYKVILKCAEMIRAYYTVNCLLGYNILPAHSRLVLR